MKKKISQKSIIEWHLNVIKHLGVNLDNTASILDMGCGNGGFLKEYIAKGYSAFGCDISFDNRPDVDILLQNKTIRLIELKPYRLPFDDNTFDYVYSNHVIEHIHGMKLDTVLAEISRVMKPGGACLHIFPSKYQLIEGHSKIPFGGVFHPYWYISLCAFLGITAIPDREKTTKQATLANYHRFKTLSFMGKIELRKNFSSHFDKVKFCEKTMLLYAPHNRWIATLAKIFPFIPMLISAMWNRAIFCVKKM